MAIPELVRFIKNGEGGQWWKAARTNHELHLGWSGVPDHLLVTRDFEGIRRAITVTYGSKQGATQDFNALRAAIDRPSQYVWVTIADGRLWWCTVRDDLKINEGGETDKQGHFVVPCDRSWNDRSEDGERHLFLADLPGSIAATAGFRGTICQPKAWREILRVIRNESDEDVAKVMEAKASYQTAVLRLTKRLRPKDFEILVDLLLNRSGWTRHAKVGETTEGVDIEARNVATNESAFVQVKSRATQTILNDYINKFMARRDAYDRMIFAVHTTQSATLSIPDNEPIQVWDGQRIAELTVRLGLVDWVVSKV